MRDPRLDKLADVLVNYSTRVGKGDNVLIEASDTPDEMVIALIRAVRAAGGYPFVTIGHSRIGREMVRDCEEEQVKRLGEIRLYEMERMQAWIGVRGSDNISEGSDIPLESNTLYEKHFVKPVHFDRRVKNTRWVGIRYPTPSMAQLASMSTEAFEDYFFKVCTLDYAAMEKAFHPLEEMMDRTDHVRVTGPGTDLSFSIKDVPAIPCAGEYNIPDGEIFTAPLRESVEGYVQFNARTIFRGTTFDNVRLVFREGRIVEATSNDTPKLNEILDADEGARYIGEFAMGVNPYITRPMLDILFDEKIAGSIHLTPGNAYDEADNGNRSSIHWDMVLLQDAEAGGGEILFDGQLIRKDGLFVPEELHGLNPESMLAG